MSIRILFICKNRELPFQGADSYTYSSSGKSSGLYNSVKFMVDMLTESNVECKLVDVADNNCIDREVNLYKPTHVIIEALWVVPSKFEVLTKLHPKVTWFVRLHSEVPFIANEGIAFDWIPKYTQYPNVFVAANSKYIQQDIEHLFEKKSVYLPNFYPIDKAPMPKAPSQKFFHRFLKHFKNTDITTGDLVEERNDGKIHIGCFGAIRPLKNQLIQAVAATRFAKQIGKKCVFHINGSRVEGKGDPVLKNIRMLFDGLPGHELVEHDWMPHGDFVSLLKQMDVTLQVSFTETYNIVAADAIAAGKPVIVSKEITFVDQAFHADPTDTDDIVAKLHHVYNHDVNALNHKNYLQLSVDARAARMQWLKVFAK